MNEIQKEEGLLQVVDHDLETIIRLSGSSVYALVNDSRKLVQVLGSKNPVIHLAKFLEEVKVSMEYYELLNDMSNLRLVVLETIDDSSSMKLAISLWIEKYKDMGYTMYKDMSPITLNLETKLEYVSGKLSYCLYVVGKKSFRKLVGIFDKKRDLNKFIKENYKDNRICMIVEHTSTSLYKK